jgi:pSer/pThr/pTyr-binding forkhead associated (FHA) protein
VNPLRLRIEPRDGAWHERALNGDEFVFGRSRTADVPFEDALVSRRHARVYRENDEWWIEDLGARNRTQLNGQDLTVPATTSAVCS